MFTKGIITNGNISYKSLGQYIVFRRRAECIMTINCVQLDQPRMLCYTLEKD